MSIYYLFNISGSPFVFSTQPKDVCCKPGDKAELTVSTSPSDSDTISTYNIYQWYFDNQAISDGLPEYEGQQSKSLLILKLLPKHKGIYWCIVENESGTRITSQHAALTAGTCPLLLFLHEPLTILLF